MKHNWKTNKDAYGPNCVDPQKPYSFGAENLGSDYHNRPKCKRCGFEFCEHCEDASKLLKTECGKVEALVGDDSKLTGFRF